MRFSTVAVMASSALAHDYEAPPAAPATGELSTAPAAGDISTAYATNLVTVTACPESVTNCPARSMTSAVVTSIVPVPMTTSTVYSTMVHTITSCGPTVVNCPAHSTIVSTETIAVSTTVCPVVPTSPGQGPEQSAPMPPAPEQSGAPQYPGPGYMSSGSVAPIATGPSCGGYPCPPESESSGAGEVPVNTKVYAPPMNSEAPQASYGMSQPAVESPQPNTGYPQPSEAPMPGTPAPVCPGSSVTAITKSYTTVLTSVEYSTVAVPCSAGVPAPIGTGSVPAVVPPVATPPTYPPSQGGNNTQTPPPVHAGAGSLAGSAVVAAAAGVFAFVFA